MIVDKPVGKEDKLKEKRGEERKPEENVQKKMGKHLVVEGVVGVAAAALIAVGCMQNPYSPSNGQRDSSTDGERLDNVGEDTSSEDEVPDVEEDAESDSVEDILDAVEEDAVEDVVEEDVSEEDAVEEDVSGDTVEEDVSADPVEEDVVEEDVSVDPVEEDVAEEDTVTDPGHEDVTVDPVEEDVLGDDAVVVCGPSDQTRTLWINLGSSRTIGGIDIKYKGVNMMGEAKYDIECGGVAVRSDVTVSVGGSATEDVSEHAFRVTLTPSSADSTRSLVNIVVDAY